jgi:murein DD-endopeptidase MepM/ murein hydrolase activator NlpD
MHTILPSRPRFDVVPYTVVAGDTIFGIAERFNLAPETVLWGNYYILYDNPHLLQPGMELNILPVNGVYHKWSAGEGLNGVADYYGVRPDDIVDWQGNRLAREAIGDFAAPHIEPGSMLVVPGGRREFISWITPRITRTNPKTAISVGPGYCEAVPDGVIGSGTFAWPAPAHYLSGYDYSPSTNHFGLDIAGETGDPIYASDNGIVVYSGWNNHGYGNVIVIDHGNGWQTVYAHLDTYTSPCGASVFQGTVIGTMGSTGNSSGSHLHFEMYSDQYGKANPWDYVQ